MSKEEKKSWIDLVLAVSFVFGLTFLFGTFFVNKPLTTTKHSL